MSLVASQPHFKGPSYLDIPCSLPESVQSKLVSDFSRVHGVRQILLVGEHKEKGITEFVLVQHSLQLLTSFGNTFSVIGINNENNALRVLEVC